MLKARSPWVPRQGTPPATGGWRKQRRPARGDVRPAGSSSSSGSVGGRLPPAAATATAASEQQPVASSGAPVRNNVVGSGNGTSSTNGNGAGPVPKAEQLQRPRIPPLPYWCSGVAVVGLPDGQTAFSFLTDSETAAARRSQLRPEARFGSGALKLAMLPAERAAGILDRWQAAATLRQTADLDTKPLLWQTYWSAHKGATTLAQQQRRRQAGKAAKGAPAAKGAARGPSAAAPAVVAAAAHQAQQPTVAAPSAPASSSGSGSGEDQAPAGPGPTPTGWRFPAAALAACTAVGALLRRAVGVGAWPLAAYRCLPVGFRRLFWRTWPPQVPCGRAGSEAACTRASALTGAAVLMLPRPAPAPRSGPATPAATWLP